MVNVTLLHRNGGAGGEAQEHWAIDVPMGHSY